MKIFISIITAILIFCTAQISYAAPSGADLYKALLFQDVPKVKELISQGADVNYKEVGRPLLGWAAQNGPVELVTALIDGKANVNTVDEGLGQSPLMRAVEMGHLDIVNVLLNAKANPNAKAADGKTVLDIAVGSQKPQIVDALIKGGADVKYVSPEGDSPALRAAQDGMPESIEIIKILGKAGANLNAANIVYTPLTYAVEQGNIEIVKALLEAGADPNLKSPGGKAPLLYADKREVIELLLNAKADPNTVSDYDSPPLIKAVENGSDEIVHLLVKAGANVNITNSYGKTALAVAKDYSKTELADFLKQHGATE